MFFTAIFFFVNNVRIFAMFQLGIQVKDDEQTQGKDERENSSEGRLANLRERKFLKILSNTAVEGILLLRVGEMK